MTRHQWRVAGADVPGGEDDDLLPGRPLLEDPVDGVATELVGLIDEVLTLHRVEGEDGLVEQVVLDGLQALVQVGCLGRSVDRIGRAQIEGEADVGEFGGEIGGAGAPAVSRKAIHCRAQLGHDVGLDLTPLPRRIGLSVHGGDELQVRVAHVGLVGEPVDEADPVGIGHGLDVDHDVVAVVGQDVAVGVDLGRVDGPVGVEVLRVGLQERRVVELLQVGDVERHRRIAGSGDDGGHALLTVGHGLGRPVDELVQVARPALPIAPQLLLGLQASLVLGGEPG